MLPLAMTSDPRPFNQQLPEPPDPRCVLEPQDNPELAPALVCALCCCFGIIYCCFGEGRARVLGGSCPRLSPSRMMPTFSFAPEPPLLLCRGMPTFSVADLLLPALFHPPCPHPPALSLGNYHLSSPCLLPQDSIPKLPSMLKASSPFPNNLNQPVPISSRLPSLEGRNLVSVLIPLNASVLPSYLLICSPNPSQFLKSLYPPWMIPFCPLP